MDEHFAVGLALECVSTRQQPFSMLTKVVDFAIEDDPDRPVLVAHGLMAGGRKVDNREAAESQTHLRRRIVPRACVVRTAMRDGAGHRFEQLRAMVANISADAAHEVGFSYDESRQAS